MISPTAQRLAIVVLISGRGSNLQAIMDAIRQHDWPVDIRAVISNRPDAYGLVRAQEAGITTHVVDHTLFPRRREFDLALQRLIDEYRPELVVLAGFMRILTPEFVQHFQGRLINIHPSLLPAFTGLDTHARALAAGVQEHGATVHFVTETLDEGPLIIRAAVPVLPGDDAAALEKRVLQQEYRIYPLAIRWFAEGRLKLIGNQAFLDDTPLPYDYPTDAASLP